MDIKDLNKSQLIMFALLLSFVTSIATGITTVTLMQQAPPSVIVPINRVVRQTVEKIVPVSGKNTVQTIIIKEEDLVVDAIAKNKSAIFSITKEIQNIEGETIEISAGLGFVISDEGIVVVDGSLVQGNQVYYVKNNSGKFKTGFISLNENGFSLIKIGTPLDEKDEATFTVPTFGDLNEMKIGQKILVLGSTISSSIFEGNENMKINVTKSNTGSLILNLDGEVLGIALYNNPFVSIDLITEAIKVEEVPDTTTL